MGLEIDEMNAMLPQWPTKRGIVFFEDSQWPTPFQGEHGEEYMKRVKEQMKKQPRPPLIFNTSDMKERQYENTLYWILGVLDSNTELNADTMSVIETKIKEALKEGESQKQVIRG